MKTILLQNNHIFSETCRFYVPSCNPEEWKSLLAKPMIQWKTGYSAKANAYSWTESNDFPPEIKRAFEKCDSQNLQNIEILLGFPEYVVSLLGGAAGSQQDLFLLAKGGEELVSITVEGKVSESFHKTASEWIKEESLGRRKRLSYLCKILELKEDVVADIRYQLLHRIASAVIEAKRFNTKYVIMLIHSFSQTHEGFEDYQKFADLYRCKVEKNRINHLTDLGEKNYIPAGLLAIKNILECDPSFKNIISFITKIIEGLDNLLGLEKHLACLEGITKVFVGKD